MTKQQAEKKVQIAIDKMIDLADARYDNNNGHIQPRISRILDCLRELESEITCS